MRKIAVVIPSYNNCRWYKRNLGSVFAQDYRGNFRVIYIDDGSLDGTGALVREYIAKHDSAPLVTLACNSYRVGALQNLYNAISFCADDELVVLLDGDDWLAHNGVLTKLNEIYCATDCWMTYGQYRSWPDNALGLSKEIASDVIDANSFRKHEWCSSHLRSFYAGLFKLIKKDDL